MWPRAIPGNTGFFVFTESPFLISYFFVQFFEEFVERDFRVVQGAGSNGEAHVVEEVEAVERRRFVLEVRSDFVPGSDGALCLFLYFEEFVIVEGTAAEVFELFDSVFEFADDVLFSMFRNREFMVERYVDVDERYVQFFSQVFIPFEQGIADVVASEDNIRKGNRRSRGVFEDFRRFACQSLLFEEFHVAHVDAAVGTDVLVVTFVFSNFEHGRSTVTGTDTSCVSFRIDDGDVHSRAEFRRSDRSGPANEAAFALRASSSTFGKK